MSGLSLMLALAAANPSPPVAKPAEASFETRLLTAHNQERVRLGMKPLVWSERLSGDAASWAKHQAKTSSFEHATDTDDGENLWMGTSGFYSPEDMVGSWIAERALFKSGRFPSVSTTGKWEDVGHYTQLVWFNTTEVGCARAANQSDDYLVCRYGPAGNWLGQSPLGR
jgi:uncharacterized protein YkwD